MSRTPQEELVSFLSDVYSIELQALSQLKDAPEIAGHEHIAHHFQQHHGETIHQADQIRKRLEAHDESPSAIKDAIMKLGGKASMMFAKVQPETPGRLVAHAYAYEAMEWAAYQVLGILALKAGDRETASVAREIQAEERVMMKRLEEDFMHAERVPHRQDSPDELREHITKHLGEAHALEMQSLELLERAIKSNDCPNSQQTYQNYLSQTKEHLRLIEKRLDELGSSPSKFKDLALKAGGIQWGLFFVSQKDTPVKYLAFVYAVAHLKIAGYELLQRVADRGLDKTTHQLGGQLAAEERTIAKALTKDVDEAVDATLEAA